MIDIVNDVAQLSGCSTTSLINLLTLSEDCICSSILESISNGRNVVSLNIGIGTLSLLLDDNKVMYKFTPSQKLEGKIVATIKDGYDPLVEKTENALANNFLKVYKELL